MPLPPGREVGAPRFTQLVRREVPWPARLQDLHLTDNGLGHVNNALDAHHELIRVLAERLDELQREQTKISVQNCREQS